MSKGTCSFIYPMWLSQI